MSNTVKQFFLGGLSLSAVNISGKIVNLLVLPILTAYLCPDDFGTVAVYMLIISFLGMVYNPGVISVTLRLYYDNQDQSLENKKLIGSSVVFLVCLPLFVLLISCIFQDKLFQLFFKNFSFWPFGFLAILASITPQVVRLWSTLWVAKHKTNRVAWISLIRIVLAISISLVLIIPFDMGAMGRILGLFVGNMIVFSIAFYDIIRYTRFKFSFKTLRHTLILGFPLVFSVFSYVIMESSDKYMLERMVGLYDLGIYDIAYTYSAIPLFLIVGFSQVWQPVFFENMKKGSTRILKKLSNYYVIIFMLISIVVITFSNEIFNLFINDKFIKAITVVPWVVFGIFFLGLSNFTASIYSYQKRFKEIGGIAVIVTILNIILNYLLIREYGITGAAIATAITYIAYLSILLFRIRAHFTSIFSLKTFTIIIIIVTLTFLSFLALNERYLEFNLSSFIGKIVFYLITIVILFFKIMSAEDRTYFYKFFKKK